MSLRCLRHTTVGSAPILSLIKDFQVIDSIREGIIEVHRFEHLSSRRHL